MKTMNDNIIVKDYKKLRKGGANSYALALAIANANTLELIKFFVNMIANNHKDKEFIIEHDGIITFSIKCNNKIIYTGTHYDVERMLQEGTYVFKNELLKYLKENNTIL